ncbi:MFS transporter [Streptomyces sp. NPDC006739]|uniref:MFS transporter n=1 Tax=Streptomyces sp. NPDC006739 TaxID=3364763 RepID=UPI0036898507
MTQILHDVGKPAAPSARARWAILGVVLAADVLDLLDSTITNIAAPTITHDLGGGPGLVQWLGASYTLALGVLLVPGGRLGDKYGRRRLFLAGLAGFLAASLACGLAPDPAVLVVARPAQGACGALVVPQGFGILNAVQQLANALGAAAVTAVYFHTARHGETHAMNTSLIVVMAAVALCLALVPLLPRKAPQEQHHE